MVGSRFMRGGLWRRAPKWRSVLENRQVVQPTIIQRKKSCRVPVPAGMCTAPTIAGREGVASAFDHKVWNE
jgi:hypothetical protein